MIIGITGTDGAGKGAAVSFLTRQKGFKHYSARAILEEELKKRGEEATRKNLRLVANELRSQYGNDYVVSHYLSQMKRDGVQDAVIESIRTIAEVDKLKENGGILLAVDADQRLRFKRIKGRHSASDNVGWEEFVKHESLEMADPDPHGMQKASVIKSADYTIMNNGTLKELKESIEEFLRSFYG